MGRRRLISFDRDIVEDVVARSGGKYTREQVEWCMAASVSYVHHLLRYTDAIAVRIPFLGVMEANMREMRVRRDRLLRIRDRQGGEFRDRRKGIELECLDRKLALGEELSRGMKRGDPFIADNHERLYQNRRGYTFEGLQDFQEEMFDK